MWFAIISAILIFAFVIQCCREIATGNDTSIVSVEKPAVNNNKVSFGDASTFRGDPMVGGEVDRRGLLDPEF